MKMKGQNMMRGQKMEARVTEDSTQLELKNMIFMSQLPSSENKRSGKRLMLVICENQAEDFQGRLKGRNLKKRHLITTAN